MTHRMRTDEQVAHLVSIAILWALYYYYPLGVLALDYCNKISDLIHFKKKGGLFELVV